MPSYLLSSPHRALEVHALPSKPASVQMLYVYCLAQRLCPFAEVPQHTAASCPDLLANLRTAKARQTQSCDLGRGKSACAGQFLNPQPHHARPPIEACRGSWIVCTKYFLLRLELEMQNSRLEAVYRQAPIPEAPPLTEE